MHKASSVPTHIRNIGPMENAIIINALRHLISPSLGKPRVYSYRPNT